MELVWILIFTIEHGAPDVANVPSHLQQIVIPHQYESEENCKEAGKVVLEADMDGNVRVFRHARLVPRIPQKDNFRQDNYGVFVDCLAVMVD